MSNQRLKTAFTLASVFLIMAFAAPASAAEYNPGVSAGQWMKYGNYVITTPAEATANPDWSMIEVVGVSGKEVTLRITGAYKNGTAIPASQLTCNIESGMTGGFQRYIIAANLNQGDKILNLAVSDTINKTETRTILGTSRSVNILNFTSTMPTQTIKVTYIYDKISGMQLGMDMETTITGAETYTNSYSIIDTNIFEVEPIPEFQSWMILPLFMTATLLVVILQKRKHATQ
jgi:hypothetical protein